MHEAIRLPAWPGRPANVSAAYTERFPAGVSEAPYERFNLATHVGDDGAAVATNRACLRDALLLPGEPVWLHQVHGTTVVDLDRLQGGGGDQTPEGDAVVTRLRGRVCALLTADCLPVLACDVAGTVVGAAHAGWRGLADGVLEALVDAMQVNAGKLRVWLGPAIGQRAFEVGGEVVGRFTDASAAVTNPAFARGRGDRWHADLRELARQRLTAMGVMPEHITTLTSCTSREPERFYSYRRDGATGRMATLIWMR